MKSITLIIFSLLIGQNALAGDAGYSSKTCTSASQRTVLTILGDYTYGDTTYTLIIDGVPAVYKLKEASVQENGEDGILSISKNGVDAFKMNYGENGNIGLVVYKDPRVGTIAENNATQTPINISLECKDYWPEP